MDMMTLLNDSSVTERRQRTRLRKIFPEACIRIAPCLYKQSDWKDGVIGFQAHRWVQETYPYLSSEEVRTLIATIDHYVKTEFASGSDHVSTRNSCKET